MTFEANHILKSMEAAALAGAAAMNALVDGGVPLEAHRKADQSFVMNLDLASQTAMRKILDSVLPVVSEEDPATHRLMNDETDYLLIDPLDGTSSCRRCLMNHGRFMAGNVGFGPMAGLVQSGILTAATFINLTEMTIYSAVRGAGAYSKHIATAEHTMLALKPTVSLRESAALYYPGKNGEMAFVHFLREQDFVENVYRFGGFANDCSRLARGFEQLEVQFTLRAWDLPAALIAEEAGCDVLMDPMGAAAPLSEWKLGEVNPTIISAPGIRTDLQTACAKFKAVPRSDHIKK